ncbi:MAG TPA: ABC transporter ATP-binding protein [Steroidobacteraceae bacterium]|nr:ABC transporter ATP-binding protein [Steroidobacteraceae bacterium]
MIDVIGLDKHFGTLHVLRALDLRIARGRVTAIVGPNGAGKTTLIKSLLGLVHPDAGSIRIKDTMVNADVRYRAGIGYMPQIVRFPENLSGRDLIALLTHLRGAAVARDEELIDAFALGEHLSKPVRTLSGGTRQKINALLAFLFRPELLVLDEPTAGLDPLSSSLLKDRILAARGVGGTVVLTSHVMSELEELADDVAFLVDGRVAYIGTLFDLKHMTNQSNLERAIAVMMRQGMAA